MKSIITLGMFLLFISLGYGQSLTTTVFKVQGNEACKESIENILMSLTGVETCSWSSESKQLTVTYNPEEIKLNMLYVYLAEAGYDSEHLQAKQRNYDALSDECKYERLKAQD